MLVEGAFDIPYRIDHLRVSGHRAKVDFPVGWWRSVGYSYNTFFVEAFLTNSAPPAGRTRSLAAAALAG
ncbi:MAG: hypothetical protein R3D84_15025 [Paracoccaceae bacterium]